MNGVVGKDAGKKLSVKLRDCIRDIHPYALKLVSSFGIPETTLRAPAA